MDINKAFELIKSKLSTWVRDLIAMMPNILLPTLILVIGLFLAKRILKIA